MFTDVQHEVLDKIFPVTHYTIGGYNLLKNDGHIPDDQQAHTDYASCVQVRKLTTMI